MKTKLSYLSVCMLLSASHLTAQIPTLNVGGKKGSAEVYLQTLDIRVDVTGNVATTMFTMTFKNRTGKILEGELLFPLPDGVTISRYALDINGKMREAVPVEKAKATQVFEEIEQRRVDPGLLERVEGNNFRTRIYPIPANGIRTVSIGYEQELRADNRLLRYRLPMDYQESIENFSVTATVWQSKEKPRTEESSTGELHFDKQGTNYVSSFSRKDYLPSKLLAFSLPVSDDASQPVMQSASGSWYFTASCYPKAEKRKKQWTDDLGVIWDVSLSGLRRDIECDMELLDILIREKKNLTINLYLLNNRFVDAGKFTIKDGDWSALRAVLETAEYDGGTNYGAVDLTNASSREFLFFSDGMSSLSDADIMQKSDPLRPIHCIVSSPRADYGALKWIAARTGGKFINLNDLSLAEAEIELATESFCFLGVKKSDAVREVYPSVITPVRGNFSVAGITDEPRAEITLLFGYGNKVTTEKTIKLDARSSGSEGNVYRIWAQKKINELDMRYEKNKEELSELGQQFGIVTRNTSLIVLETLQDYITYGITPPAELRDEYNRWRKGQEDRMGREQQSLLANAVTAMAELKRWWEKDFKPVKSKYPRPDKVDESMPVPPPPSAVQHVRETEMVSDMMIAADMEVTEDVSIRDHVARRQTVLAESVSMIEQEPMQNESANKKELIADKRIASGPVRPDIKLTPIKQDKDYMKTLTGKTDADYKMYLKTRSDYIGTPGFYFDMADWFFRHNDRQKALQILTSIADMDLENASLYRLIGYRLKEYGEYALEAYICQKVIQWRPMEPQSYRDYALALTDAGRDQEALDMLYSVLTQSYAQNINRRSAGIEEVTVTELNRLITTNNKLNVSAVDKSLIKSMPVDIRVVINWNMNNTDIDLHVIDPNGETCFYGHKETAAGGRISNDITQGYGPEQFMLKKAIKGKYRIYVNYYGDSQVKAEGPSTVMVEIYTGYSAGTAQQRRIACLQMSKESKPAGNGLIQVAEFEF